MKKRMLAKQLNKNDGTNGGNINMGDIIDMQPTDEKTALIELPMNGDFDAVKATEQANKRVEFFKKIKNISLKITNPSDWVDQNKKPYLQASGAEKLKPIWGIYVRNISIRPMPVEGKPYPMYECKGIAGSKITQEESEFIGGRNANDPFFVGNDGTKEVDLMDVMKAAYANFEARAVKQLLGMGNLTWDDVKTGGISKDKVTKVEYKNGSQGGQVTGDAKTEETREKIRNMVLEMANNDIEMGKNVLREYTKFKDSPGKDNVKFLSVAQVPVIYRKVKEAYDNWLKQTNGGAGQ